MALACIHSWITHRAMNVCAGKIEMDAAVVVDVNALHIRIMELKGRVHIFFALAGWLSVRRWLVNKGCPHATRNRRPQVTALQQR